MSIPIDYQIGLGALVSVCLGWVLGQGTAIARDWRTRWRLRRGLITELEDVRVDLRRVTLFYMRQLQFFAHSRINFEAVSPITHLFFQTHYKDIFDRLNRAQRISYQHTHAAIDAVNVRNEEMGRYVERLRDTTLGKTPTVAELNEWGARIQIAYMAARTAVWHVETHLQHRRRPVLEYGGPIHEHYTKFQDGLRDEIADVVERAKSIKPEDLEPLRQAHVSE